MTPPGASRAPSRARRRRAPTPADLALLAVLLGAVPFVRYAGPHPGGATRLAIRGGTEPVRFFDPGRDTILAVAGPLGPTVVRIERREAWIVASPCRNQICVRMGHVRAADRALVCLPNRVMVRFEGRSNTLDVDAVTR
jgi:hypothetical protein